MQRQGRRRQATNQDRTGRQARDRAQHEEASPLIRALALLLVLVLVALAPARAEIDLRDTVVGGVRFLVLSPLPGKDYPRLEIAGGKFPPRARLSWTPDSVLQFVANAPYAQMAARTRPLVWPARIDRKRLLVPTVPFSEIAGRIGGANISCLGTKCALVAAEASASPATAMVAAPRPFPEIPPSPSDAAIPPHTDPAGEAIPPDLARPGSSASFSDRIPPPSGSEAGPAASPPADAEPPAAADAAVTIDDAEDIASATSDPSPAAWRVDPKRRFTIVLDPGHGGKDPGAHGTTTAGKVVYEKDATLAVGLKLRERLRKHPRISVVMTREQDEFIPLGGRTRIANEKKGDIFISLHANAIPGSAEHKARIKGYRVYLLREAMSDEDKAIERRENEAIRYEGGDPHAKAHISPVEWLKLDHQLNLYTKESERLAQLLVDQLGRNGIVAKEKTGAGQAGFFVLVGSLMPSVLIEMGYISNPHEAGVLSNPKRQDEIATAIERSILEFLARTR